MTLKIDNNYTVKDVLLDVYNAFGPLLSERFYQAAIAFGLDAKSIDYETKKPNVTDTHIVDAGGLITHTNDFYDAPGFAGAGDYHLAATSSARNRGWPSEVHWDIDGEPRDPMPDLGADEYFDPGSIRQVYVPLVLKY